MQSLNVVLLQSDPGTAQSLLTPLRRSCHSVQEARSVGDLRVSIEDCRTQVVILDLEMASIADIESLARDFPGVDIVCNHRLADETMWTATLNAGAADCCPSYDTRAILAAALRNTRFQRPLAA